MCGRTFRSTAYRYRNRISNHCQSSASVFQRRARNSLLELSSSAAFDLSALSRSAARDRPGRVNQQNYFNSEEEFQFLKKLQDQDLIVPVVGDLSGPQAMKAIGQYIAEIKERVSAFYVSNVEFYLQRQGTFDKFVENVKSLPIDNRSVIIRSYFNYYAPAASASRAESLQHPVDGAYRRLD